MTFLGRLRRRQSVAARWLTAAFAVAWLGLALQPCAAMESHDAGTASHGSAAGQAGHDCPHCPPPADPEGDLPCGNALSCDAVGAPAVASKAAEVPAPDLAHLMPLPDVLATTAAPAPGPLRPPRLEQRRTPASSLQQRFCSFLK
jgi:hypothetical protein